MLKMILDPMGGILLTNDGHAILREIDVAHPAAKSMIELSRTQDEEVGDGTTSVIILGKLSFSTFVGKANEQPERSLPTPCPCSSGTSTPSSSSRPSRLPSTTRSRRYNASRSRSTSRPRRRCWL